MGSSDMNPKPPDLGKGLVKLSEKQLLKIAQLLEVPHPRPQATAPRSKPKPSRRCRRTDKFIARGAIKGRPRLSCSDATDSWRKESCARKP